MSPLEKLNREFRNHLEEIMYATVKLHDPYGNIDVVKAQPSQRHKLCHLIPPLKLIFLPQERVTIMQWIRKLQDMDDKDPLSATQRNQYSEYLRITMDTDVIHLCAPFKEPPPVGRLRPLCEVLANFIATKCPPIPMTGPIEPVMSQSSEDGKVYTTVRQSPDGSIYCYLAITSDIFDNSNRA